MYAGGMIILQGMDTFSERQLCQSGFCLPSEMEFITALAYKVYRGYIVFVFSVTMFVCLCVNFFSVQDFSGTPLPRILQFGTNIEYDLLYCVRQTQHPHHSLYLSIFSFSPIKCFVTDFSAPVRVRVCKFCIHLQRVEYIV